MYIIFFIIVSYNNFIIIIFFILLIFKLKILKCRWSSRFSQIHYNSEIKWEMALRLPSEAYLNLGGPKVLITSFSPSQSEALSHPCRSPKPPEPAPEPLPAPATRAPRPSPRSLPQLHQPLIHCQCRAVTALTLPLHCSRPHCQFSSPVPLAQRALPCHSSSSATEPCLSYYRACASHTQ